MSGSLVIWYSSGILEPLKRAIAVTGVASILEPSGATRSEGNRSDGLTLLPYAGELPMASEATIVRSCASKHP